MAVESEKDINISMNVITSLKLLSKKRLHDVELSNDSIKEIVETAFYFGNKLPKLSDSSLFEIDDLIYQDGDVTSEASDDSTEELGTKLRKKCIERYISIYLAMADRSSQSVNRTLDRTYLQAIRLLPVDEFESHILYSKRFMTAKSTTKLCLFLKILKVFLEINKNLAINYMERDPDLVYLFLWMKKLQNIPEARHPHQKRITSWLSCQTTLILQAMDSFVLKHGIQDYLNRCDARPEQYDARYINLKHLVPPHSMSFCNDHIYSFFMSAKDEEEKIQRLKDLLIGMSCNLKSENDETDFDYYPDTKHLMYGYQRMFIGLYKSIFYSLLKGWGYTDDTLRSIEKHCGCEVKHYLLRDNANDVVAESNSYLKDDKISNKTNCDDEPDYTIEKFIFYDDFVKQLQSLNIIHTACMMCQELLGAEGDAINCDTEVFRDYHFPITIYLAEVQANPSKRGKIPWLIEILIKKCPFMILPKRYEHMMGDLVKMLKGEVIDELTEEKLFLRLNCTPKTF